MPLIGTRMINQIYKKDLHRIRIYLRFWFIGKKCKNHQYR